MEGEPGKYLLAEGAFMVNSSLSAFVFVKMRYLGDEQVNKQNKVVNSVWRLG